MSLLAVYLCKISNKGYEWIKAGMLKLYFSFTTRVL